MNAGLTASSNLFSEMIYLEANRSYKVRKHTHMESSWKSRLMAKSRTPVNDWVKWPFFHLDGPLIFWGVMIYQRKNSLREEKEGVTLQKMDNRPLFARSDSARPERPLRTDFPWSCHQIWTPSASAEALLTTTTKTTTTTIITTSITKWLLTDWKDV